MKTIGLGLGLAAAGFAAHAQEGPAVVRTMAVIAAEPWNDTGLDVRAGENLTLTATGTWRDATIDSSPDGYEKKGLMTLVSRFRRSPHDHWFALVGCVGRSLDHCFTVGAHATVTAPASGRLFLFANDVRGFYWNNSGKLQVTITPGAPP